MVTRSDSLWKSLDWVTICIYLLLIIGGWFSVCGASYDYGERDFLDFSTRAGKQFVLVDVLRAAQGHHRIARLNDIAGAGGHVQRLLSDRRVVPKLCSREKPQKYQCINGYPTGLCKCRM